MFEEKRMANGGRCFVPVLDGEPGPTEGSIGGFLRYERKWNENASKGTAMAATSETCDQKTLCEPPALRERVGRELRRVEFAAEQRNRIGELYALLEMNPDVARILELREQLGL